MEIGILVTLLIESIKLIYDEIKDSKKEKCESLKNIYDNFNKVHDNYLESFRKYRDEIDSNRLELSGVIELIKYDILSYRHLLNQLLSNSVKLEFSGDSLLCEFVKKIYNYLEYPDSIFDKSIEPLSNIRRMSLINILEFINKLTPERIITSGLLDDIRIAISNNTEYEISSLQLIQENSSLNDYPITFSEQELIEVNNKVYEIKKYLATRCIIFITKKTQDSYYSVTDTYLNLKI